MIDFIPHSEIAMSDAEFDSARHRETYRYNYGLAFKEIAEGKVEARAAYRSLIKNDLFFIVHIVMGIPIANHPFVVRMCKEVESGESDKTLDVWAREHFKSTILTQAETIRDILRNPEECHVIFSYKKPKAEDFLFSIKQTLESEFLKWCFPDVLYGKPETQSPSWSLQNGITVRRESQSRKEKTVEAYGIMEGMPTGGHWERRIYDDIETADLARNPDQLKYLIQQYELSRNLGTMGGRERVIGTYYSHYGLLTYLRDKVGVDGKKVFKARIVPATEDGRRDGRPIFLTQKQLDDKKMDSTFQAQQLCDPTPSSEIKLDGSYLKPIEPKLIPRTIHKFMVLDQAGGDETDRQSKDLWSYGVLGIEPVLDDIGQSNVYLLDVEADQMSHSEGIEGVVRMYLRNGIIQQMGVEKVGLSTTEIHITGALRTKGRRLSLDAGNLKLLRPAGRSKEKRVETALQWPLNNGKLHYSTAIPQKYIDAIREEMQKFPFFHVDILDMLAYAYDLFKEFRFPLRANDGPKVHVVETSPLLFGLREERVAL